MLAFYWAVLATATHWPALTLPQVGRLGYDKLIHVAVFAALTWFVVRARLVSRTNPLKNLLGGVLIVGVYAVVDETTQPIFSRIFALMDLLGNLLGVVGVLLALLPGALRGARRAARDASVDPAATTTSPAASDASATQTNGATPPPTRSDSGAGSTTVSHFVSHARTVGLLTLVSRLTGLVRDAALAATFGLGALTDAFFIGFLVPNLFRRLFGEGALAAAFIPAYADLLPRDRQLARRFASVCITLLAIVLAALTLVGELILGAMVTWGEWSADANLTIRLTMVMLPYMPLICLAALVGGLLQVHRRFGPPAASPILLNLTMIGAVAMVAWGGAGEPALRRGVFIVAAGVLVAGVLQLGWLLIAMRRCESLTFGRTGVGAPLRAMLLTMLPMVVGLAVFQINTFLDGLIAFGLSPKDGGATALSILGHKVDYPIRVGAVGALQWSQRLYQFPLGVFGIAIATAIFPALSHAAAQAKTARIQKHGDFATILRHGLRLTVFIGLPASVGLIMVRAPLVRLIFERGEFSPQHTQRLACILLGYASGIWAYSMTHVLTRAFYALKDARTPLIISLFAVALNLVLNLTLIWSLGASGLAWSTALSASVQCILLLLVIRRYVPSPADRSVLLSWARTALLTAIMTAAIAPLFILFDPAKLSAGGSALVLSGAVAIGIIIFAGGAYLTRAEEMTWLLKRSTS